MITTTAFWICAIITLVSTLMSLGFSIAFLNVKDENTRLNALYSLTRSFAIAVVAVIGLFYHSRDWLIAIATIAIIFQAGDALIGVKRRKAGQTFGPAFVAIANAVALVWFM